jgi:hypothetical protein
LALGLCVAAAPLSPLSGQGILDRLENKVRERVERKTEEAVDKTVDKAANTAEHAVRCVVGEDACIKAAKAKGAPVVVTDTQGAPVTGRDSAAAIAQATQDTAPIAAPAAPAVPTGPAASTEPGCILPIQRGDRLRGGRTLSAERRTAMEEALIRVHEVVRTAPSLAALRGGTVASRS